jgi:hypothetical protein
MPKVYNRIGGILIIMIALLFLPQSIRLTLVAHYTWNDISWVMVGFLLISITIFTIGMWFITILFFSNVEIYENGFYNPIPIKSIPHRIKHKERIPFIYFDEVVGFEEHTFSIDPIFYVNTLNEKHIIAKGKWSRKIYEKIMQAYMDYENRIKQNTNKEKI